MSLQLKQSHPKSPLPQWVIGLTALLLATGGIYLIVMVAAPWVMMPTAHRTTWSTPVVHAPKQLTEDRLYIPRLKLNIPFAAGDTKVLESGAWHRFPERGDPKHGGNFILAGHRLQIGRTPGATVRQSPFYHLDKLQINDNLFVDFDGVRYKYQITHRQTVKPDHIEIESPTSQPRLTLYTCTLKGQQDGREVFFARLTAKNVDPEIQF